jgi:hypothetical protein
MSLIASVYVLNSRSARVSSLTPDSFLAGLDRWTFVLVQAAAARVTGGVHELEVRGRVVARVAVDVVELAAAVRDAPAAAGAAPALLVREPGPVPFGRVPVEPAGRVARRPTGVLAAAALCDGHAGAAGLGAGAGCSGERHARIVAPGEWSG